MPATATLDFRNVLVLAPEIVLAIGGLIVLIADLGLFRGRSAEQRGRSVGLIALISALAVLVVTVGMFVIRSLATEPGAWYNFTHLDYLNNPDPYLFFGTISSDIFTDAFNVVVAALLVLVVWFSNTYPFTENWGEYFALLFWSTVGVMLLMASEELLTLFLTLETMTICLYLSTAFEKSRRRSAEGAVKYFVFGSVSSALFLFGLSLVYGLTGSTRFDAIHQILASGGSDSIGLSGNVAGAIAMLLIMVGFGFKVAAVPFHQWAPDAYEGAPAPVTAWIATGSKIASFAALMKVLIHALGPWSSEEMNVAGPGWIGLVAAISAASMTYGNFAALAQKNYKRMLAYSSVAHAGYMLVGVAATGVSTERFESAGAVLYYLLAYAIANVGAFALAAWLARDKQSDQIDDLNGMAATYPGLSVCILLLMLSLIGMPPLAGFFGKLYMFMEALAEGNRGQLTLLWLVALGLLNSVVSAFYYVRVLKAMFLRPASGNPLAAPPTSVLVTIVLTTVLSLGLGLYPAPAVALFKGASTAMFSGESAEEAAARTLTEQAEGARGDSAVRREAGTTTPPTPPPAGKSAAPAGSPSATSEPAASSAPAPSK